MSRTFPQVLLALLIALVLAGPLYANTYYVAAIGSDSNSGTSKTSPWLHAPGMSTATGTAAATGLRAGDSVIFRGGDTWHFGNSSLSPFAGFTNNAWNTSSWNGSASNCDVRATSTVGTVSCIYLGVDQTWWNSSTCGSNWCRPILNADNPVSTAVPASCKYQDGKQSPTPSLTLVNIGNYTILDNFEILGYCWDLASASGNVTIYATSVVNIGTGSEFKNNYMHGWSMGPVASSAACHTNGTCDGDEYWAVNSPYALSSYSRMDHNVFDGSDSTFGNLFGAYGDASGGIFRGGGEVDHNVLWHVSNGVKDTPVWSFHDNLINYLYEPSPAGTHGNIFEMGPYGWTIDTYVYNNVVLNAVIGEGFDLYPGGSTAGKSGFVFNNVVVNPDGHAGVNCYMLEGNDSEGAGMMYFFNNTSVSGCIMRNPGRGTNTATLQNNHFIGYSPATLSTFSTTGVTSTDDGNEVWQSVATANGQGYTVSNYWKPTASSNATVGTGANLTALCNSMDNATASAACKNGIGGVTYDATVHAVRDNTAAARGSSWDAGAYQFASSAVNPPSALSGTVK